MVTHPRRTDDPQLRTEGCGGADPGDPSGLNHRQLSVTQSVPNWPGAGRGTFGGWLKREPRNKVSVFIQPCTKGEHECSDR